MASGAARRADATPGASGFPTFSHECYFDERHGVVLLKADTPAGTSWLYEWDPWAPHVTPTRLFDARAALPYALRQDGSLVRPGPPDVNAISTWCCDAAGDELILVSYRLYSVVGAFKRSAPFEYQGCFGRSPYFMPGFSEACDIALDESTGEYFSYQHHAHALPREEGDAPGVLRLLMYDNRGKNPGAQLYSRAVEYALNLTAKTATQTWEFRTEYSENRGSAHRFGDGSRAMVGCPHCAGDRGDWIEVDPALGDSAERARFTVPPVAHVGPFSPFYRVLPLTSLAGERRLEHGTALCAAGADARRRWRRRFADAGDRGADDARRPRQPARPRPGVAFAAPTSAPTARRSRSCPLRST